MLELISKLNEKEWFNPCWVNIVGYIFGEKARQRVIEKEKADNPSYPGPCMQARFNMFGASIIATVISVVVITLIGLGTLTVDKTTNTKTEVKTIETTQTYVENLIVVETNDTDTVLGLVCDDCNTTDTVKVETTVKTTVTVAYSNQREVDALAIIIAQML